MKEIIALIVFLSFTIITIYLAVNKQIGTGLATIIFCTAILSGFAIANYDFIKTIEWRDFKIETFEREVTKIKDEAISKIEEEVEVHKEYIEDLTAKAKQTQVNVEKLSRNTLKYSFFIIDPFTGLASTGGAHASGGGWAAETDLGSLMTKARAEIKSQQYDLAKTTTKEIENIFPNYPGAIYLTYLIYQETNQKEKAFSKANELIEIMSELHISPTRFYQLSDVYKYAIQRNLGNGNVSNAKEIARKALEIWPDEPEFKKAIQ